MADLVSTRVLQRRVAELKGELAQVQAKRLDAEHRAAVAERSCREAWQFARALGGVPMRRTTD